MKNPTCFFLSSTLRAQPREGPQPKLAQDVRADATNRQGSTPSAASRGDASPEIFVSIAPMRRRIATFIASFQPSMKFRLDAPTARLQLRQSNVQVGELGALISQKVGLEDARRGQRVIARCEMTHSLASCFLFGLREVAVSFRELQHERHQVPAASGAHLQFRPLLVPLDHGDSQSSDPISDSFFSYHTEI